MKKLYVSVPVICQAELALTRSCRTVYTLVSRARCTRRKSLGLTARSLVLPFTEFLDLRAHIWGMRTYLIPRIAGTMTNKWARDIPNRTGPARARQEGGYLVASILNLKLTYTIDDRAHTNYIGVPRVSIISDPRHKTSLRDRSG